MINSGKVTVLIFLVASILAALRVAGQEMKPDTAFLARAVSRAVSLYDKAMNRQFMLYNGAEYIPYPEPYVDHPYFGSEYWEEGSVQYYGQRYDGVSMQYDLLRDILVIEHYDQKGFQANVALHFDKVDYFELLGHWFVRIAPDSALAQQLRPGFYDLLHDGRNKVLCKRKKTVHERIDDRILTVSFRERSNLFLIREGQVFPIKGKHALLKALSDKKRMLKQFIRREVTDFRNKEKLLVDLVRYYDTLE